MTTESDFLGNTQTTPRRKTLSSYNALNTAKVGTRVLSRTGFTARRVVGGWRYETSSAAGLFQHHEMLEMDDAPYMVLEEVAPDEGTPPVPRTPSRIIGRLFWDPYHSSPWVSFDNITAYRTWAADIRKQLPGTRTEYARLDYMWTADSLLRSAERKAQELRS